MVSTRPRMNATGMVQVKLGFIVLLNMQNLLAFEEVFSELVKCSQSSLVSEPPIHPLYMHLSSLLTDHTDYSCSKCDS
jgi:hypothetical protein